MLSNDAAYSHLPMRLGGCLSLEVTYFGMFPRHNETMSSKELLSLSNHLAQGAVVSAEPQKSTFRTEEADQMSS